MNKLIVIAVAACFCSVLAGSAQSGQTFLIYGIRDGDQYYTRVISDSGSVSSYPTVPGICGTTTPNGLLDAESSLVLPTGIDLTYIPTNEVFATIPWRENWDPCSPYWLSNTRLEVRHIDPASPLDKTIFEIRDNVLREVPVSFPPTPARPELPHAYDIDRQVIVPSNNYTKFLYYSCPEPTIVPPDGYCTGRNQGYVIYDVVTQRTVGMLSDAFDWYLIGHEPGLPTYIYSIGYHAWSPDDRYIMYPKVSSRSTASPALYDTVSQSTLDTGTAIWDLDVFRRPQWSPDSRYVAFWVMGRTDYEQTDAVRNTHRTVVIYDTQQQQFIFPNLSLEIGNTFNPLVWSPNTPELVVWDAAGNLYRVNVETGDYELIDTQVTGVIAWSFPEPIPSVELPAPTSSPTPP
jgi:hypothetical protein